MSYHSYIYLYSESRLVHDVSHRTSNIIDMICTGHELFPFPKRKTASDIKVVLVSNNLDLFGGHVTRN